MWTPLTAGGAAPKGVGVGEKRAERRCHGREGGRGEPSRLADKGGKSKGREEQGARTSRETTRRVPVRALFGGVEEQRLVSEAHEKAGSLSSCLRTCMLCLGTSARRFYRRTAMSLSLPPIFIMLGRPCERLTAGHQSLTS